MEPIDSKSPRLYVKRSNKKKLMRLKLDIKAKSIDEVVEYLMGDKK